jgi:hypothetical protein
MKPILEVIQKEPGSGSDDPLDMYATLGIKWNVTKKNGVFPNYFGNWVRLTDDTEKDLARLFWGSYWGIMARRHLIVHLYFQILRLIDMIRSPWKYKDYEEE